VEIRVLRTTKHGRRTVQLLVYFQVHHHWWYGCWQVVSSASVHREKM